MLVVELFITKYLADLLMIKEYYYIDIKKYGTSKGYIERISKYLLKSDIKVKKSKAFSLKKFTTCDKILIIDDQSMSGSTLKKANHLQLNMVHKKNVYSCVISKAGSSFNPIFIIKIAYS